MTENDPRGPSALPNVPGGPMSERMQALLSRAAEEQLTEQRQVSAVLADLRTLVSGLQEQLRGTASSARLETLGGDVSSLFTELRMSTSALGDRLDDLSRRVDEQAAATSEVITSNGSGNEALAVRVQGLAGDLEAQATSLDRLTDAVGALGGFPDALSALQRELSGMHDRLAPLGEVRTGIADLAARTGALEALRPDVVGIASRLDGVATAAELTRTRDSLVAAVTERLDRVEGLAAQPSLTTEDLQGALAPVLARLDELSAAGPVVERLGGLDSRLAALEDRLGEVTQRLGAVGDAAGGVPAVASDLARVAARVEELAAVREDVTALRGGVSALQDDARLPSLVLGVTALRDDLDELGSRVGGMQAPTAEAIATSVSQQVTDRLVDELAPRVADVVLTRVAATLVEQVSGSVTASVQSGLTERVRAATADSERRISAHVDEAVLALAEALLRRRRSARPTAAGLLDLDPATGEYALPKPAAAPVAPAAPAQEGVGVDEQALVGQDADAQGALADGDAAADGAPVEADAPGEPETAAAEGGDGADEPPDESGGDAETTPSSGSYAHTGIDGSVAPAVGRERRAQPLPEDRVQRDGAADDADADGTADLTGLDDEDAGTTDDTASPGDPSTDGTGSAGEPDSAEQTVPAGDGESPDVAGDGEDGGTVDGAADAEEPDDDEAATGDGMPATASGETEDEPEQEPDEGGTGAGAQDDPVAAGEVDDEPGDAFEEDDLEDDEEDGRTGPGFTTFSMPRRPVVDPTPDLDEDVEEPVPSRAAPQRVSPAPAAASSSLPAPAEWDDDEDDEDQGPPRRPWWRPGG